VTAAWYGDQLLAHLLEVTVLHCGVVEISTSSQGEQFRQFILAVFRYATRRLACGLCAVSRFARSIFFPGGLPLRNPFVRHVRSAAVGVATPPALSKRIHVCMNSQQINCCPSLCMSNFAAEDRPLNEIKKR